MSNTPQRLNLKILDGLPERVEYKPPAGKDLGVGIVHLGIGAFHRAHQAVYTDDVMALEGGDWKITGVSLRSAGVRDQLQPQDCLYTLVEMDENGMSTRIISSISEVLVAPENPQAVIDAMSRESCKIISLTITEKGYCHHPATGRLNREHPEIAHDLNNPASPRTAIGFIVAALRERRPRVEQDEADIPTILCCDNLPNNGRVLKKIVVEYALLVDEGLGHWIERNVSFPNTMVDRIAPAIDDDDVAMLANTTGYIDRGMVKTEVFKQWVIEDSFTADRPAWEKTGAMMVSDVEPFESAKLRLLNGSHSALAYLGFLNGYEYVHQVVGNADFYAYLEQLMACEILPTLEGPDGLDLSIYVQSLLHRYANHYLQHKTYQIAMDGSQKLPQRLLHTIEDRLKTGAAIDRLVLAVAAWIRYSLGFDQQGEAIEVQDPLADRFREIEQSRYSPETNLHDIHGLLDDYLAIDQVFDQSLAENPVFRERLCFWLSHLLANGVSTTLKVMLTNCKP